MKHYDYILVGGGLFNGVVAREAGKQGKSCLVVEKRDALGGNIMCRDVEGILVHEYGAHIFHTSNEEVWKYVTSLAEFNHYINCPVANYHGETYNLPFNMNTFSKMWGITFPAEAKEIIESQKQKVEESLQIWKNRPSVWWAQTYMRNSSKGIRKNSGEETVRTCPHRSSREFLSGTSTTTIILMIRIREYRKKDTTS